MVEVSSLDGTNDVSHLQQLVRELAVADGTATQDAVNNTGGMTTAAATETGEAFDQISYTVKQIIQLGKESAFNRQLGLFIARKDSEIERMCNTHYQEFVQSIDQLLKIRAGTTDLKEQVSEWNSSLQESGTKMVQSKKEVIDHRKILLNLENALEAVQTCLFVLEITKKINAKVDQGKYYNALKTLDELQTKHLRHVASYSFAKGLQDYIPQVRHSIKEAVLRDVRNWLTVVHEDARIVGQQALSNFIRKSEESEYEDRRLQMKKSTGKSLENLIREEADVDALDNAEVRIDFIPLYQCIHVHDFLGRRQEFKAFYSENRQLQASSIFKAAFTLKDPSLEAFEAHINDIAGFFIIESTVMHSTLDFRAFSDVESLWDIAITELRSKIESSLFGCDDPDIFLSIKMLLLVFIQTMEVFGYPTGNLKSLMESLLNQYSELVRSRCCDFVSNCIETDEYTPTVVQTTTELKDVNDAFVCDVPEFQPKSMTEKVKLSSGFPMVFPFSKQVPKCCSYIKAYIINFYRFSEGFTQQSSEMDDILKKSMEIIISQSLNVALTKKLNTDSISQLVQVYVNIKCFMVACVDFEDLLTLQRAQREGGRIPLLSAERLETTEDQCIKRIFELIKKKMDQFFENIEYVWTSTTARSTPSVYLMDITNYLTSLVTSTLQALPKRVTDKAYHHAFEYVAQTMMDIMESAEIKKFSVPFLLTIDVDVQYLEGFTQSLGLSELFAELRQLVNYLKSEDLEIYLNPETRSKLYYRINPKMLGGILEKFRVETSMFTRLSPEDLKRKTAIEKVCKFVKGG